jgi:hypothetical protein
MNWIKDGQRVNARYLGTEPRAGIIVDSRVRYGGKVSYTVILDEPATFPWRSEPTTLVNVDQDEIAEI